MDSKQKKKLLIGGGIMTAVLATGVGVLMVAMSPSEEAVAKGPYETVSAPTLKDAKQQPGIVSIDPIQIQLERAPSGSIEKAAAISALFQDFTPGTIQITGGDPRLKLTTDCTAGKPLPMGQRCTATVTFDPSLPAPQQQPNMPYVEPELLVQGNSRTPGGATLPVEARAKILPPDANALAAGVAGQLIPGATAPVGLDPYGPVATPPPAGTPDTAAPPPVAEYTQPQVPVSQPTLSPREQFLLARRQAVLGGVQSRGRANTQPQQPQGTWADLKIPTSMSSYPQDMSRVVTMDRVITAVLARTFDSRSTQQVVAQVDRNVYGAHGRAVLIPRGSQIIGTASGGGERMAVSWTQIIRPDGARLIIQATAGDAMGQAGVPGRRNERLLKRYGSILLGTIFGAGTAIAFKAEEQPSGDINIGGSGSGGARNNGAIISDIVRQDLQKITSDIQQRTGNVQPIVTVPAGTRVTIIPTMDIVMRPMQGPVQEVQSYPRAQNAGSGAPQFAPRYAGSDDSGYDTPQPRQAARRQEDPFPAENIPATGSTPPWNSN
ncbi:TrbI/VirB10 family protein [Sphingosinicella sp. BN140058]|uniref:TrbI/VirB10 family protein n=1 Tax=Sphingosinicella sp. BN140058 TaxID=1892855 RepID=UPI00101086BD|nr:TrbI/VirB10 family protein [Sphingosinicella sp. BN140058]QAY80212.1 hypothetical protein ETR14_26580 [Sphingosinicella sp. BN140058]